MTLTIKICRALYTYKRKHMSNSLCSNAADIHFSLPTCNRKHCQLPRLLGMYTYTRIHNNKSCTCLQSSQHRIKRQLDKKTLLKVMPQMVARRYSL